MNKTATTLRRAHKLIDELPDLSSGAKMVLKKDVQFGWTWAADNPIPLKAKTQRKGLKLFTIATPGGHSIHLTGTVLTEMVKHARHRFEKPEQRKRDYQARHGQDENIARTLSHARDGATSAQRVQRDYQAGLRTTFTVAGWGHIEFVEAGQDSFGPAKKRGRKTEHRKSDNKKKTEQQTDTSHTLRKGRTATNGAATSRLCPAKASGPDVRPQKKEMVWVADQRNGGGGKRITVHANQADLTGEL